MARPAHIRFQSSWASTRWPPPDAPASIGTLPWSECQESPFPCRSTSHRASWAFRWPTAPGQRRGPCCVLLSRAPIQWVWVQAYLVIIRCSVWILVFTSSLSLSRATSWAEGQWWWRAESSLGRGRRPSGCSLIGYNKYGPASLVASRYLASSPPYLELTRWHHGLLDRWL